MNPHFESRDLIHLEPEFAELVKEVIQRCAARKVVMVPFFTLRGPGVQARLFCQSRTIAQIQEQSRLMQRKGAPWLSSLMRPDYGTDHPKRDPKLPTTRITNAPPGISWHQWGKACDCYVQAADGSAIWDANHFGYEIYGEEAQRLGLEAGVNWKTLPDAVHVQSSNRLTPLAEGMEWQQIENAMMAKFKESR